MTETIDTIPEHPDEEKNDEKTPVGADSTDEDPAAVHPTDEDPAAVHPADEQSAEVHPAEEKTNNAQGDQEDSKEEISKTEEDSHEKDVNQTNSKDNATINPPIEENKDTEEVKEKINANNDNKIVIVELSGNQDVKQSPEIVCEPMFAERLPSGKHTSQNVVVSTPKCYTPPFLPMETASPSPIPRKRSCFQRFRRCICFTFFTTIVIGYAVGGAYLFSRLEMQREIEYNAKIDKWKNDTAILLATELRQVVPYEGVWARTVFQYLEIFEKDLLKATAVGYKRLDDEDRDQRWTWTSSLFFSIVLMTTTGYGSMTPRSKFGRSAAVVYSIFGVPLAFAWLIIVGHSLAICWISLFRNACCRLCGEDPKLDWEDVFLRGERESPRLLKVRSNSVAPVEEQHLIPQTKQYFNNSTKFKHRKLQAENDARFPYKKNYHSTGEKNQTEDSRGEYMRQAEVEFEEISKTYRSTEYAMAIIYSFLFFVVYYVFGSIWLSILEGWSLLDTLYINFLMFMTLGPGCHELENDISEIKMKSRLSYSMFLCIGYCILSMSANLVYLMFQGKGKYRHAVLKIEALKTLSRVERY